ncbi:hypothetical protein [Pandoraea pulmonicola]|nr:hypothetical protein [Pandoraea pulmonicola]
MLQSWKNLGKAGICAAGGLSGLARQNNLPPGTVRNYLRVDGRLTQLGEDRLNPREKAKITDALLQSLKNLDRAGIKAAGGLEGLAKRNNVSVAALRHCFRADGSLTHSGEGRLNPGGKTNITYAMLQAWKELGRAGIKAVGGLDAVARRDNVPVGTLRSYLREDGDLTQLGEDRLASRRNVQITNAMLRKWKDLGQAGIAAAGGLSGLARRHNVPAGAIKSYLRADGRLTQIGEDRLNPAGKTKITNAMLRKWEALGQAGIEAADGLNGIARRANVPAGALKHYLHADGRLTQRGEDRLNPSGKMKVTAAMLRKWKALGQAGIEAAGGLNAVARQDKVPATALKNYLRADGRLTPVAENRLRKAGAQPM